MGGSTSTTTYPPPVDYSQAMMYQSDNNKTIAMGQIMAQNFAVMTASMDREMQIAANLEQGLESLDTKLQIAKLNYIQSMSEEENRHEEKMAEIGVDVDAARSGTETTEVSDFLANSSGSYSPGAIWNDATEYADGSRPDFSKQWDDLMNKDSKQNQNWQDTFQKQADADKAKADADKAKAEADKAKYENGYYGS